MNKINQNYGRLRDIRCWLLDMDGTVTLGEEALPGADRFFERLRANGMNHIFVTNNSSHSAAYYMKRLARLDLPASRREVLTSTDALALYLKTESHTNRPVRVYPVGTPEFAADLSQAGVELVSERRQPIDYVVLGFDTTLVFEKLDIACDYIRQGVPYLAANPDRVCPMPGGRVLPDCGALIAFMETCTDIAPLRVIGKPDPLMADMVIADRGFRREELAMVGDRIYTDLAFARNAGITSVAVLTGEADQAGILQSGILPDFIFPGIGDLADCL
jgi:HAD superfamily hydrolase (TIGR01450 family)